MSEKVADSVVAMTPAHWRGVIPAITTPFAADDSIDRDTLAAHARWMVDAGCTGIVAGGSLGEGATLARDEKQVLLETLVSTVGARVPVIAAIASASTREAVALAVDARRLGCHGLMVLPPYVYRGAWVELRAHMGAVFEATPLSCMLYNNPIAYGVDFLPEQVVALANEHDNLHAVKESSADVRRITAIRHLLDERVAILVGVDDLLVEGVAAGAVGWIAGLVNAFPQESVRLFELAATLASGDATVRRDLDRLYRWFLPLLRMDVVPEFVHLVKLCQNAVARGSTRVRGPRLEFDEFVYERAAHVIATALATRPSLRG